MRYVLHYAAALVVLAWLFYVPGAWLDRAGARRGLWPGDDVLVRFTLGIAAWQGVLFTAAALGSLRPSAFRLLSAGVAASGLPLLWRERRALRPPGRQSLIAGVVPVAAFLWVLWNVFLLVIRPTLEWDADTYHLTVPRLYIEHGGFRPIELNVYSNWPLAVNLLYALGLMLDDWITATTLHFGLGVLALLGVYRATRCAAPAWAAVAAAAFFLGNGIVQMEMSIAYVELGLAFFFLQACVWMLASFDDPSHERGWLLLAGLACGLLASTKHMGLFGVLAIGLVHSLLRMRDAYGETRSSHVRSLRRGWILLGLPTCLMLLPWLVKSFWYTGNPVYPFLHEVFGGPDWSAELSRKAAAWQANYGVRGDSRRMLELPLIVFSPLAARYPRFFGTLEPFWAFLLPLTVVLSVGRRRIAVPLLLAFVYFWLWAFSSQQMRFLVAILPLLAVAVGLALARVAAWLPAVQPWAGRFTACAALVVMIRSALPALDDSQRWWRRYVEDGAGVKRAAVHTRFDAIERLVPADGRILFLNTNHGFFCQREFVADSFFEASQVIERLRPFDDVNELHAFLRRQRITHVLHHPPFHGMVYPRSVPALLADPSRAVPLYRSSDGYTLYELR